MSRASLFLKQNKKFAFVTIAVFLLVATVGVGILWHLKHPVKATVQSPPSGFDVAKIPAPKQADIDYAKQMLVVDGRVTAIGDNRISIMTSSGNVLNLTLATTTIYQRGKAYKPAAMSEILVTKDVKIVYNNVSNQVRSVWYLQ